MERGHLWQHAPEEYRQITQEVVCTNPLSYEEILNWRGFSFESSRVIKAGPITSLAILAMDAESMEYGIAESDRIINNVLSKAKGY